MQLDVKARELTLKLVYYGPALSGKTTNLQAIHRLADEDARGRLMTLDTRDDRTLFFDLLPLSLPMGDLRIRIKLFTVPGQVIHAATRRLVLNGADGVAFIADSQRSEAQSNASALEDLRRNLEQEGMRLADVPYVVQFNKRDLPNVRSDAELDALAAASHEPIFKAIARSGVGVTETLLGLLERVWAKLDATHDLSARFHMSGPLLLDQLAAKLRGTGSLPPSKTEVR